MEKRCDWAIVDCIFGCRFLITSVRNISLERIIDLSYDLLVSKMKN